MTSLGTLVLIEQACQNLKTLFVAYNLHSFYIVSFRNPLALSKWGYFLSTYLTIIVVTHLDKNSNLNHIVLRGLALPGNGALAHRGSERAWSFILYIPVLWRPLNGELRCMS